MTVSSIEITFVIGILILIGGAVTKKKWLMLISILPLAVALVQVVMLFMI